MTAPYVKRILDLELNALVDALPAIAIEGPKAVGKTRTASGRARTLHHLDDPAQLAIAQADPARLLEGHPPILIDEWQRLPEVWDLVRRGVDAGAPSGQFLLTGSALSRDLTTHSGAARIVTARMRPLALAERSKEKSTVSVAELLTGKEPTIQGRTSWTLGDYVDEILQSGFPGLRGFSGRPLRSQLDSYLARIVDHDFADELGRRVRKPDALRRWMTAYAAASSTTATFATIREAAIAGDADKPSKDAISAYRDALERLWILDPVPAWAPTRSHIRRLAHPIKHQLADPALAARLLGVDKDALLDDVDVGPQIPRDGTLLGALFESLVTLSLRVYAQAAEAERVSHLRTRAGEQEVDLIVERGDGRVVAVEVKLARNVKDQDVRHLQWLSGRIGDDLLDAIVITTGPEAYRRPDGIGVVPASILGP